MVRSLSPISNDGNGSLGGNHISNSGNLTSQEVI